MHFKILLCFLLFQLPLYAQVKTLIPKEEEVNLPLDSTKEIILATTLTETRIGRRELAGIYLDEIKKTLHPDQFFIIDTTPYYIELFIVYPCKVFNLENIQKHEIINEGIITSSMYLIFKEGEYDIILKDFEWIDNQKKKTNLNPLYHRYLRSDNIKEKVKYYGILKSCEMSIADSYSYITVIIEEVIRQKSLRKEPEQKK